MPPAWDALHQCLPTKFDRLALGHFIRYCAASRIEPDAVDDTTLANFAHALQTQTLLRDLKGILDILFLTSLRRRNLAALDLERHFRRDKRGRITQLFIPGTETKNGMPIEADLTPNVTDRLDRHLKIHRPHLPGASTTWLFPGREGHHRHAQKLPTRSVV